MKSSLDFVHHAHMQELIILQSSQTALWWVFNLHLVMQKAVHSTLLGEVKKKIGLK
jgi:hypothetical protein